MSLDPNQQYLDSEHLTVAQRLEERIKELQTQVEYYEHRELEHKDLETHMRNSYSIILQETDNMKKELALSDQRNKELREQNIKIEAELSDKINVLLNDRYKMLELRARAGETWYVADKPTTAFIRLVVKDYETVQFKIDTETGTVSKTMGVNKLNADHGSDHSPQQD